MALACEEYQMKDYFFQLDLNLARQKFHQRAFTVKSCISHFPSDKKFLGGGFFCPCKKENKDVISLFHWRKCELYSNFREFRDLNSDFELTKYYADIIRKRTLEDK